jgi:hypothetical protein
MAGLDPAIYALSIEHFWSANAPDLLGQMAGSSPAMTGSARHPAYVSAHGPSPAMTIGRG